MTALYTSTLAGVIAAANSALSAAPNAQIPAAGLAAFIARRHSLQEIEARPLSAPADLSRTLRQAPALAGYGFHLKTADDETRSAWTEALETLQGRSQFPGDGQYFANDPVELLGVMSGIQELEPNGGPHSAWLAELIRSGLQARHIKTPITALAAIIVLAKLDPSSDLPEFPFSQDELLQSDVLLLCSALILAFDLPDYDLLPRLETAFSKLILEEQIRLNSPAQSAAAIVLAQRLSDRVLLDIQDDVSTLDRVIRLCRRFPLFVKPLQNRYAGRPAFEINDEYDVQDLFHGILKLHFDDVRPEEVAPSVAGGSSRVDFYLKRERLIIEAKFMGQSMTQKKLRSQLIDDITLYAAMDQVDQLVCLVYDPNLKCQNPKAIEDDLQNTSGRLEVRIIICPQGH